MDVKQEGLGAKDWLTGAIIDFILVYFARKYKNVHILPTNFVIHDLPSAVRMAKDLSVRCFCAGMLRFLVLLYLPQTLPVYDLLGRRVEPCVRESAPRLLKREETYHEQGPAAKVQSDQPCKGITSPSEGERTASSTSVPPLPSTHGVEKTTPSSSTELPSSILHSPIAELRSTAAAIPSPRDSSHRQPPNSASSSSDSSTFKAPGLGLNFPHTKLASLKSESPSPRKRRSSASASTSPPGTGAAAGHEKRMKIPSSFTPGPSRSDDSRFSFPRDSIPFSPLRRPSSAQPLAASTRKDYLEFDAFRRPSYLPSPRLPDPQNREANRYTPNTPEFSPYSPSLVPPSVLRPNSSTARDQGYYQTIRASPFHSTGAFHRPALPSSALPHPVKEGWVRPPPIAPDRGTPEASSFPFTPYPTRLGPDASQRIDIPRPPLPSSFLPLSSYRRNFATPGPPRASFPESLASHDLMGGPGSLPPPPMPSFRHIQPAGRPHTPQAGGDSPGFRSPMNPLLPRPASEPPRTASFCGGHFTFSASVQSTSSRNGFVHLRGGGDTASAPTTHHNPNSANLSSPETKSGGQSTLKPSSAPPSLGTPGTVKQCSSPKPLKVVKETYTEEDTCKPLVFCWNIKNHHWNALRVVFGPREPELELFEPMGYGASCKNALLIMSWLTSLGFLRKLVSRQGTGVSVRSLPRVVVQWLDSVAPIEGGWLSRSVSAVTTQHQVCQVYHLHW